jgi:hypothetical protein
MSFSGVEITCFNGKSGGFSANQTSVPHQLVALWLALCTTYCGFGFTRTGSFGCLAQTIYVSQKSHGFWL